MVVTSSASRALVGSNLPIPDGPAGQWCQDRYGLPARLLQPDAGDYTHATMNWQWMPPG